MGPCFNWSSVGAGGFDVSKGLLERAVGGVAAAGIPKGLIEVGGGRGAIKESKLTSVALLLPKNDSSTVGFYMEIGNDLYVNMWGILIKAWQVVE